MLSDDQSALARLQAIRDNFTSGGVVVAVEEIHAILAHVEAQAAEIERLRAGLQAVSDLIDESHGVAGLHRNGDVAPWGELRTGGRYEEWLVSFDDALEEQR